MRDTEEEIVLAKQLLESFVDYLIEQESQDYEDLIEDYFRDDEKVPQWNSSYEELAFFAKTHEKPVHIFQDIVKAKELLKKI